MTAFAAVMITTVLPITQQGAQAATRFTVTAHLSAHTLTAGQTATIHGSVSPARPGKTVYLKQERRNHKWRTIDWTRLGRHSRYSFSVKPRNGGTKYYKVVKPRERTIHKDSSPVRTLRAYRWIYLEDLVWPDSSGYYYGPDTINGTLYLHALSATEGYLGDSDYVVMNLGRKCTTVTGVVGLDDNSSADAQANILVSADAVTLLNQDYVPGEVTPVSWDVTGDYRLRVDATGITDSSNADSSIGGGKALCSF